MKDIASQTASSIEWIEPQSASGEVFRVGADVAFWEGDRVLRIEAVSVPDRAYRQSLLEAVDRLSRQWGGPLELVLDFVGKGPPGPGEAMALCKSLKASGQIERIIVVKQPWMPVVLLSAVTRLLSASGMTFEVREADR